MTDKEERMSVSDIPSGHFLIAPKELLFLGFMLMVLGGLIPAACIDILLNNAGGAVAVTITIVFVVACIAGQISSCWRKE